MTSIYATAQVIHDGAFIAELDVRLEADDGPDVERAYLIAIDTGREILVDLSGAATSPVVAAVQAVARDRRNQDRLAQEYFAEHPRDAARVLRDCMPSRPVMIGRVTGGVV